MERVAAMEWLEVDLLSPPEVEIAEDPALVSPGADSLSGGEENGDSVLFPSPPIWVPDRMNPIESNPVNMKLMIPSDQVPEVAGPGMTSFGELLATPSQSNHGDPSESAIGAPPQMPWQPSQAAIPTPETENESRWQITGEVARRTVIYQPPPPRPETSIVGTVHLKFWVLPDGTIDKIVPIVRSDPEVERVAREYLQKWRFETVDNSMGRQSGTIPIRFKIR